MEKKSVTRTDSDIEKELKETKPIDLEGEDSEVFEGEKKSSKKRKSQSIEEILKINKNLYSQVSYLSNLLEKKEKYCQSLEKKLRYIYF
jgi:hypothetical protein